MARMGRHYMAMGEPGDLDSAIADVALNNVAPEIDAVVGVGAPATFEDMVDRVWHDARAILIDRQIKYGPMNIARHLMPGLCVRLGDKLSRLDNVVFNGQGGRVHDETVADTLVDIMNYGLIGLCVERGWWTKEGCPPMQKPRQ